MTRTPLVFLPGLLCDDVLWRAQASDLADIADPFIADLTQDDTVAAMAQRVLAHAPDRFALAALSMGGYVAFEILRQAPERVTRLALFDTRATPDHPDKIAERRAGIASLEIGQFRGVTTRLLPRLVHASHVTGPVGDEVKAMALRVGGPAFMRQQLAILGRPDSRPLLPTITVPTLIAVGDQDVLTPPSDAKALHDAIPRSSLHTLKACGHLPALEQPKATSALLRDWLTKN